MAEGNVVQVLAAILALLGLAALVALAAGRSGPRGVLFTLIVQGSTANRVVARAVGPAAGEGQAERLPSPRR